jgi:DDE superfamily endonuclease
LIVDKQNKKIICVDVTNGKRHDFRLYKESGININPQIRVATDTGYLGLQKIHPNTEMPKKKSKKKPLTKEDKAQNKKLSQERVLNENVIGVIKRFKIIADKYRNRRKRFGLRFNLIAGIYNFELSD